MKFTEPRFFAGSDVAARRLVEIANDRAGAGRPHLHRAVNAPFLKARLQSWRVPGSP